MQYSPSLSRRCLLLIVVISPVLLGSEFRCVAVSNPSVTTAHIDQVDPLAVLVGDPVRTSASGSGTQPLQFAWDFGDGSTLDAGSEAAHIYTAPGSYRITLTVRDATARTAHDSVVVSVSSQPSLMVSLVVVSDAIVGKPVEIEALTSEADASALSFDWRFSDGQSAIGSRAAAIFPMAGVQLASVTVTNDAGAIGIAEIAFDVVDTQGIMRRGADVAN